MKPMAPLYDRARSQPVRITDYESTTRLQGPGLTVTRIETVEGSGQALVTWRNNTHPDDVLAAEQLLMERYQMFCHGTW